MKALAVSGLNYFARAVNQRPMYGIGIKLRGYSD